MNIKKHSKEINYCFIGWPPTPFTIANFYNYRYTFQKFKNEKYLLFETACHWKSASKQNAFRRRFEKKIDWLLHLYTCKITNAVDDGGEKLNCHYFIFSLLLPVETEMRQQWAICECIEVSVKKDRVKGKYCCKAFGVNCTCQFWVHTAIKLVRCSSSKCFSCLIDINFFVSFFAHSLKILNRNIDSS